MAGYDRPRLIIVNCASPYFFAIPMGAFGLADYLEQRGVAVQLINPALYREDEANERLTQALETFQPTHAAFAFHWQETAHGLLGALATVRAWNPTVPTLCGGFTASYFAQDLLRAVTGLDYVVIGDPEEPIHQLVNGRPTMEIANLVWRSANGTVQRSRACWLMEQPLLDTLSYARLDVLVDADLYIKNLAGQLGWALFLGRGCVFNCDYCGGSRYAFQRHSNRGLPVVRSLAAVLADLHRLVGRATTLYLCYENDPVQIIALFRAIAADPNLRQRFTLNYGAWHLLDGDFLDAYQQAFVCSAGPPVFEFSPEVVNDTARRSIKRSTTYTLEQMSANIREVDKVFAGHVRIEVFFSRYHPGTSEASLLREIKDIICFKHRLFVDGVVSAHVCFDHLSTDAGSRYWERFVDQPTSFAAFLTRKAQIDAGSAHSFPVDNLCLYLPPEVDSAYLVQAETLIFVLERLEQQTHELVHVLTALLGVNWLDDLFALLPRYLAVPNRLNFWQDPPLIQLLKALLEELDAGGARTAMPFLLDLFAFSQAKLHQTALPLAGGPRPIPGDGRYVLDRERLTIHGHDYLDLHRFLDRLAEADGNPAYERTVFVLLDDEILAMPYGFYRATLMGFETPRTLASYLDNLADRAGFNHAAHAGLVERLVSERVLLRAEVE